jgi:hypothetical protein
MEKTALPRLIRLVRFQCLLLALLTGAALAAEAQMPAFQLGATESAAAGRATVRFQRTNALMGAGGLSVDVKVDGRAVCKLERGRDCRVSMPAGRREVAADNAWTTGVAVAALTVREDFEYLIEIDAIGSGLLSMLNRGDKSTEAGMQITRNDGSYQLALKSAKPVERAAAAASPPEGPSAAASSATTLVAGGAPEAGPAGDSAAQWALRRRALAGESPDNLRLSTALALLLDVPGEQRGVLLKMESDFDDKPFYSSLAAGLSTARGLGFGWSWQRRSDPSAVDGALENCAARTDPGGCVTLVRQRKFVPEGVLALADKLSSRDYASTRQAFLRALESYQTPR